jgi:Chaperone of endosialidase
MPVSNVPTPGSPIRSNWAQSVSNVANANEANKVNRTGDTMTGSLVFGQGGTSTTVPGSTLNTGGRIFSAFDSTTGSAPNFELFRSPYAIGMTYIRFNTNANAIGSITAASGTTCAYNTSSDRRIKDDLGEIEDAVAAVLALRPINAHYHGAPEGDVLPAFIADEVETVVPGAVTGEAGAVTTQADVDAGAATEVGRIMPQQLDLARLVPVLTAAIRELAARVEQLEAGR